LRSKARERSDKGSRSGNLKVLCQRRLVGPLLHENETIGILSIYVHSVRDAARFRARTSNMLLAQAQSFLNSAVLRDDTSDYQNHSDDSSCAA
jgi:hypothetical protein